VKEKSECLRYGWNLQYPVSTPWCVWTVVHVTWPNNACNLCMTCRPQFTISTQRLQLCSLKTSTLNAITMGGWVFEHLQNLRQNYYAHKSRLKLIVMTKGSIVSTAYLRPKNASRRCLLEAWICAKVIFGRGFALDTTEGAYSAPQDPPDSVEGLVAPSLRTPPPPWHFGLWPYGLRCLIPQTPQKINPSYGIV